MERRKPLARMSAKRRAALAAAGNPNPWSTIVSTAGRGITPRLAAPTPKKRRHTGPTTTVRALVRARSSGLCEWPGCPRPGTDLHHRLNRKQGGRHGEMRDRINGAAWLLDACRPHHERVTSPVGEVRVAVEQLGWVLREHQDAEVMPVFTRHGWVLLTPDGGFDIYSPNRTPNRQEVSMAIEIFRKKPITVETMLWAGHQQAAAELAAAVDDLNSEAVTR